jgi:cytochrome c556
MKRTLKMERTLKILSVSGLGVAVLMLAGCAAEAPKPAAATGPVFKGVVPINDIMVDVVDHNAHQIWNAVDPKMAPKTDQDWHNLEHAAVTLAASGNMIQIPGPPADDLKWTSDPEWPKYAQVFTDAAAKASQAVDKRDLKALEAAGNDIVASCESCHKKFKPVLPAHIAKPMEQPEHYHKANDN